MEQSKTKYKTYRQSTDLHLKQRNKIKKRTNKGKTKSYRIRQTLK
jgi:hypothetical protein